MWPYAGALFKQVDGFHSCLTLLLGYRVCAAQCRIGKQLSLSLPQSVTNEEEHDNDEEDNRLARLLRLLRRRRRRRPRPIRHAAPPPEIDFRLRHLSSPLSAACSFLIQCTTSVFLSIHLLRQRTCPDSLMSHVVEIAMEVFFCDHP